MSEFKRCPFCGGDNIVRSEYYNRHYMTCMTCKADGPMCRTKEEAKEAWNRGSTDEWIPCEDRLPEKVEKKYWVSLDTGGQCECRWTDNRFGLSRGEWGWSIFDHPQYTKVVAWKQLAGPYKEEKDE